ncbi:PEP-CTERM sorting domain-containing protein [Pseudoduganella sp. DS3]|uniref:PEP-CTERM sorting domain-containing protein n=2 Tax=Pseudoduganella guangdongensis TaxID=2692179 RepID=A0A6N9HPA3_9BURK|nr:PEP-CTERM sorting domain-containing protein [Pseudoduganella guangdongensis]
MYLVSVDTKQYGVGASGFLDFVFNGQGSGPAVTATMSNLQGFDMDPENFDTMNDASAIAGGFQLLNSAGFNDVYYQATFGGVFSFMLSFAGDASAVDLSTFSIFALDAMEAQIGGALLELTYQLLPGGEAGAVADVQAANVAVSQVPEPGALALAGLGLLMLGVARRQRRA